MRFAFQAGMCAPDQYLPLAKACEEIGFDAFTLPDSICYPKESDSEYPYNDDGSREFLDGVPFIEPFSLIPAMAAVTQQLHFTTSVMKLPIRQPVLVAKSLSSVAVISNNRFTFGVGLSPWPEDFAVCNEPWKARGKRMDEMVEMIRGLMTGDYYGFEGEHYQLAPIKICPVPSKPVPILFGGHADAALKRAARTGDGWVHAGGTIETLKPFIDRLNELRKEYQRDHLPFEIHAITKDAYSADGVRQLEDMGVTECIIGFRNVYAGEPDSNLEEKLGQMNWFADEVIEK
ncbi:MAG: TIGR03619 family F420-dependent LLM class oxidoreductase [Pseudomonadales bacterium]